MLFFRLRLTDWPLGSFSEEALFFAGAEDAVVAAAAEVDGALAIGRKKAIGSGGGGG